MTPKSKWQNYWENKEDHQFLPLTHLTKPKSAPAATENPTIVALLIAK